MRNRRTPQRPILHINRPVGNAWKWTVAYEIGSSGYAHRVHVTALRDDPTGPMVGAAWCDIKVHDDLSQAIEDLAVEAMLAACEPQLDGSPTTRRMVYSTHL